MKILYHPADSRGRATHGWLQSQHTFSFADYYDPNRMGFGALRVINDDTIAGSMGFGMHPHRDMEIITLPLIGKLEHQDSMGNQGVIEQDDIQVMSAGTGIRHSEINADSNEPVSLLQIWVIPNQQHVTPRYQQLPLKPLLKPNQFNQILSPNADDNGVWIHQNAWFNLGEFETGQTAHYSLNRRDNGVYVVVISGKVRINGQTLSARDGLGVWEVDSLAMEVLENAKVLLMEVPM